MEETMSDPDPDRNETTDAPDTPDTPESPAPDAGGVPPAPPAGSRPPALLPSAVPAKITTIGILCLVDGILNILYGLAAIFGLAFFGIATLGIGCLLLPLGLYPLVLGVLGMIYGIKLLSTPPRPAGPARWLAVMQIVNVLWGNVISLVVGIVNLVLFTDPEVVAFFDRMASQQSRQTAGQHREVR